MLSNRFKLQYNLKSFFILILGIAIGFSLNLQTWQLLTKLLSHSQAPRPYVIAPPDVLKVDIYDPDSGSPQPASSLYAVAPNGRIYLDEGDSVYVADKTISEAQTAIEQAIGQHIKSPKVVLDLVATNSKVFYVITKNPGTDDSVQQFHITGNDTALDAIARAGGKRDPKSSQVWIARTPVNGVGSEDILAVEWDKIVRGDPKATNHLIRPGDRVYISPKPVPIAKN